jgi:hypothetical protein
MPALRELDINIRSLELAQRDRLFLFFPQTGTRATLRYLRFIGDEFPSKLADNAPFIQSLEILTDDSPDLSALEVLARLLFLGSSLSRSGTNTLGG